ncbi:MAG TPA: hypothetical protein VFV43_11385 [Limnobacter sp.]|nr:hypothetical protein [Limnobacter sp.]
MFKRTLKATAVLTALMSMHSIASATCSGPNCDINIDVEVKLDTSYQLSPNHNGIFIQTNRGAGKATVDLNNVVMRNNGNISANATAIGNTISVDINNVVNVPVRHISQSNYGAKEAKVDLQLNSRSVTGEVALEAVAVGNNIGIDMENRSLAELSLAQCNVGDVTAAINYSWDPTKLTANATAIGNSISVGVRRP